MLESKPQHPARPRVSKPCRVLTCDELEDSSIIIITGSASDYSVDYKGYCPEHHRQMNRFLQKVTDDFHNTGRLP